MIELARTHPYIAVYHIKSRIDSEASSILFAYNRETFQNVCLKIWRACDNGVYNSMDVHQRNTYLLNGWSFNPRYAPNVYLGIAPIFKEEKEELWCGPIMKRRIAARIDRDKENVLVMRELEGNWRLDCWLRLDVLSKQKKLHFLAAAIARMHTSLVPSPEGQGTSDKISAKLDKNVKILQEALEIMEQAQVDSSPYRFLAPFLKDVCASLSHSFDVRYTTGHIKRCHGDLKCSNLWVRPVGKSQRRQFLALDCVDFNPEYCHIDTLSDIAMLVVDLEMYLDMPDIEQASSVVQTYFLDSYLFRRREERDKVQSLLKYYIIEKAIICAYMCILYGKQEEMILGKKYLDIAAFYAKA